METLRQRFFMFLCIFAVAFVSSCGDDDDTVTPVALDLESLSAGDTDLNAATAPTNVPSGASIVAVFTRDMDASTANTDNITLVRDYDNESLDLNISTSGNTITINPAEPMGEGTQYMLSFNGNVAADDGETINAFQRSFTTTGSFMPAGQIAYWPFDGDANDAVGDFSPATEDVVAITYGNDRLGNDGGAAVFDGDASIIEVPNGPELLSGEFSMSYWIYINSENHLDDGGNPAGHFIMGLGNFRGFQFETNGGVDFFKMAKQYALSGEWEGEVGGSDFFFNGDGIPIVGDSQTPDEVRDENDNLIEIESYNRKVWVTGTRVVEQWGHNRRIIRYADVLLMAAEVSAQNNNIPQALNFLNEVRRRARGDNPDVLPDITETNPAMLLESIYDERRFELALEGHRYPDLVRTGKAVEVLGARGFTPGRHELLPIPQVEIDLTEGRMQQNPGWN
jgi:hypothetical protein